MSEDRSDQNGKNGVTASSAVNTMPTHLEGAMRSARVLSAAAALQNVQRGTMERRFETEIKALKGHILSMAGFVEQAIEKSTDALLKRDAAQLNQVFELEAKINQAHIDVDDECLKLLARLGPVAADLRLILAIIKINTDLERMGDQSVNLAKNTQHYLEQMPVDLAQKLPYQSGLVRAMVRESLDAFVSSDVELAHKVLGSDDTVDAFKKEMVEKLTERMKTRPEQIEGALNLILVTRNLERMADHATNIAEDVIFACTGRDVRHGRGREADEAAKAGSKGDPT